MASASELPELAGEFYEMATQYVREQTLEPAKKLGRLAGFSFAGAILFMLAAIFLAVAGMRAMVDLMPEGEIWSGLGYIASGIAVLAVTGFVMWRAAK